MKHVDRYMNDSRSYAERTIDGVVEAIRVEYDSKAHWTRSMDNRRCRRRFPLMIVWPTTVIIDDEGGGGDGGPAAIKHVYAYFITTTEIEPP